MITVDTIIVCDKCGRRMRIPELRGKITRQEWVRATGWRYGRIAVDGKIDFCPNCIPKTAEPVPACGGGGAGV